MTALIPRLVLSLTVVGFAASCSPDDASMRSRSGLLPAGIDPVEIVKGAEKNPEEEGLTAATCGPGKRNLLPKRLWRLTNAQYMASVETQIGARLTLPFTFEKELKTAGFANNAEALVVADDLVKQYAMAAELIAEKYVQRLEAEGSHCGSWSDEGCYLDALEAFAYQAFRRPLSDEQQQRLRSVVEIGKRRSGRAAVLRAIEYVVQSPFFLYRQEQTAGADLDQYELASALAFLITDRAPDDILLGKAKAGQLSGNAAIAEEARRLMALPDGKRLFSRVLSQLFELDTLDTRIKSKERFPFYSPATVKAMQGETDKFIQDVFSRADGSLEDLFTATYTYMNQHNAPIYGRDDIKGDAFVKVALDPQERRGILTQPSLLSVLGGSDEGNFIGRGKFVREILLCQHLAPPPPGVTTSPAVEDNSHLPLRDRFAAHSKDALCKSCHKLIDPIGFGFEHYDGLGRFMADFHSKPINATGEINSTKDANGEFTGIPEMALLLADSKQVSHCFSEHFLRYALGSALGENEQCHSADLNDKFLESQGSLQELVISLVTSDVFTRRNGQ